MGYSVPKRIRAVHQAGQMLLMVLMNRKYPIIDIIKMSFHEPDFCHRAHFSMLPAGDPTEQNLSYLVICERTSNANHQ